MKPDLKPRIRYATFLAFALGAGAIGLGTLPADAARNGFGGAMGQGSGGLNFSAPNLGVGPSGSTLQHPPSTGFFRDDGSQMGNTIPSDELNCLTPQHMPTNTERPPDC